MSKCLPSHPAGFPPVAQAAAVLPMARVDLAVAQCSTKIMTTIFTRKRALSPWWSVLGSHLYKFSPDSTFLGLCASIMCSFFVWLPLETACCRLVLALAFDVSEDRGRLELEGYWCRVWMDGAQGGGGVFGRHLSGLILSISQPTLMALVIGFYARL